MAVTDADGNVRAAGCLLWRERDGVREVALIHRDRYDDWTIPKGKVDPGEDEPETARREVEEETGHVGELGQDLGVVSYPTTDGDDPVMKVVRYWTMQSTGGTFIPNDEVDELEWLALDEARRRLTYDRDRDLLDRWR